MKSVKKYSPEIKHQNEKERLELIEKKVEIQKKRLELKKEKITISKLILEAERDQLDLADKKVSIQSKQLVNKKAKLEIEEMIVNRNLEAIRLLNDKIYSVLFPLIVNIIDPDRTILGSEPFYKPLLEEENKAIALEKLMELICKL